MKKAVKVLVIIVCVILALVLAYMITINILKSDSYDYTLLEKVVVSESGSMLPNSAEYSLYYQSGQWKAVIERRYGFESEKNKRTEFAVSTVFVDEVIELLKENQVSKWEGNSDGPKYGLFDNLFSMFSENVSDGARFSFSATFRDGKTVDAYSDEPFPEKFQNVLSGFRTLYAGMGN